VGVPRPGPRRPGLGGLADGAQRFDLVVDDETGVLVELATYYQARLLERVALRHLTLGDIADPRLFDLAAVGPDAAGRDAAGPVPRKVPGGARPLAELAGEVDFRLCLPAGRPFLGRVERRPQGAVVVAFPAATGGELLTVSQSGGAGIADTTGWERISLPDGTPASWWPPDGDLLQGHLVFDRAGTRLWVRGVDRAAMTALALSLHPAR